MKVIEFFSLDNKTDIIKKIIWYSPDNTKRTSVIKRVETYLYTNELTCVLSVVKLYENRRDFEAEFDQKKNVKAKFECIYLGCD